jgi:Cyclopropane fatty acid synthase and related methyltransferases
MFIMKKIVKQIWISIHCWTGVDLRVLFRTLTFISPRRYFELKKDLKELKRQSVNAKVVFPLGRMLPCYQDRDDNAGAIGGIYFWQDLYVAQRIFTNKPKKHVDVGSSVGGFVTHVASYRPIEVLDIRSLDVNIPNVTFRQHDIMDSSLLQAEYTDSISSLHVLEHFGLGRYGDPICYDGYLRGFENMTYLLKPQGKFYLSVPLGEQRIEFHGHRVFSLAYLLEMVSSGYVIDSFSYVDDKGDFFPDVEITDELLKNNCNCLFGCAILELTKK